MRKLILIVGLLLVAVKPVLAVETKTEKWNGWNSVRMLVTVAERRGVEENTIVMLLLLPLVATVVSMLHYVIGLSGYGIFMPTMIAVTFLATGILGGLGLFGVILLVSVLGNLVLRKLRLHFWPARAINLLLIAMGTFGLMMATALNEVINLGSISIFPVLFMILLAEEFTRTQLVKSRKEAVNLMIGTLILAVIGALLMGWRWLQETVLWYPEAVILTVLMINLVVGNYSGMRLSEIKRFKAAIREKKK